MDKKAIHIERELHSNSPAIIWSLISTAAGLEKWIADSVNESEDELTFTWGSPWSHHETRKAKVTQKKKNDLIRLHWEDDDDDVYWEMRMEKSEITNDYILCVTDFAPSDDVDSLYDIWEQNFAVLHRSSGL